MSDIVIYDRQSIMAILSCSYSKARKVYTRIYNTIPAKSRKPEHKRGLPADYVKKYLAVG